MTRCFFVCLFLVAGSVVAQENPLTGDAPPELSTEEQEIHQFFADYESATSAESASEQTQFFDFDEITRDVVDQSGVAVPLAMQKQLAAVMRGQVEKQLELLDAPWTRHRIVKIEFSEDKSVADVFVRSWSNELGTSRESYLLKQVDDEWRICDVKQLSIGVSTVALSALGLRDTMQSSSANELVYGMQQLTLCANECATGNVYAAMEHIDAILGYPIPESMQTLRWTQSAVVHGAIDPEKTIEALDKADAFGESTLLADYLRGVAYSELGRYEVAVDHLRAYVNHFGADADAYYSLGYALEQLGRSDEAIDAYKAALADTPESIENVGALGLALPDTRKSEFTDFYRNLPDPIGSFEQLGDGFVYDSDAAGLRTLIDATIAIDSDADFLDYYRAKLEQLRGNHLAAFDALETSLGKMDDDAVGRTWSEYALCDAARRCDRVEEAYAICTDKAQAIETLADRTDINGELLPQAASDETIDALLAKYLAEHENDFDASMLVGRSRLGREEYDAARECFVKALASTDDSDQHNEALGYCVDCYVALDRPLDAYEELEPKSDVVDLLEYALDDEEVFQKIVERFRADEPESLRFLWDGLDELLESGEYQTGLDRVNRALAVVEHSDDEQWLKEYLQKERARFLIGLKRYDDAILAAHSAGDGARDFLRALIYAAKGKRQQFIAAYERCLGADNTYLLDEFASAPEIPEGWLPEPPQPGTERYSPYTQVRRVVLLLDEPCPVNASRVIEASRSMGEPLYAIDRRQMTAEEDDYVFQANDDSVIVATDKCRYFIQAGSGPYLHDADLLAADLDADEELSKLIGRHSAWMSIDIFKWPQGIDQEETRAIPTFASKRLAEFARHLSGKKVVVAIHSDMQFATQCDDAFFVKLSGDTPISAFRESDE